MHFATGMEDDDFACEALTKKALNVLLCHCTTQYIDMGVSKNSGIPKWMGKIMENPIKMDDLGVPLFWETPIFRLTHLQLKKHKIILYTPVYCIHQNPVHVKVIDNM